MFLHNQKKINLTSFFRVQTFRLYYIWLFWSLKIEKARRLNFVSFSGLENSETKLRNETKLSETKLSADSIRFLAFLALFYFLTKMSWGKQEMFTIRL